MTGRGDKHFGLVVGSLALLVLLGGCHRERTPEAKQARLIAAENMQLKKSLAGRDEDVDRLKAQHAKELEQRDEQLAAAHRRIETLESDLQKGIAERVNSVLTKVMDENARLRQEAERLRAEIEKLKAPTINDP